MQRGACTAAGPGEEEEEEVWPQEAPEVRAAVTAWAWAGASGDEGTGGPRCMRGGNGYKMEV